MPAPYLACLAVGDDGDLDLVTTDYFAGMLKVLLNGGDGTGSNWGGPVKTDSELR